MFDFHAQELKILDFWKKEKIFQKSLEQTRAQGGKPFVFFEGPPTANGRPGIHHLLARAFKDIIPRYKTMQGFHVVRKAGWDTHGLPVEIEVEKKLGLSSKAQIENIVPGDSVKSIAAFNKACKESVWTYVEEFRNLTERYGYWVDLDNPYITYENNYIESLWWIIAQFYKRGFLKKDFRVAPYCFRCGTSLSSHELALGYQTVKDISVYVKFRVMGGAGSVAAKIGLPDNSSILAWTTTPWTLPGNVALAVHNDIEYALVKVGDEHGGDHVIVAKERMSVLEATGGAETAQHPIVVREFKGSELVGLRYEQLFSIPQLQSDTSHQVYAADFVSAGDGTGIVHTAVMYGADDYELGSRVGLPKKHTVTTEGKFEVFVPEVAGMRVRELDTDIAILKYLAGRGLLFKKEKYEHEYPFCWRCKNPVLYYALESFVVEMSRLREEMIAANQQIMWVPEHIKEGRFGEWLNEVKDWNFSRNRYWGTPLPIWVDEKTGAMKVIESFAELKQYADNFDEVYGGAAGAKAGAGVSDVSGFDPHRPFIDQITISCDEGKHMKRVPYVADVWFDSGSMPFAQYHYPFENGEMVDGAGAATSPGAQYPADYICEGMDQTRGWFYTLHAVAAVLGRAPSFKGCISHGLVLDENGKKMSKSLGNVVDPWKQIEQYGADAIRWFFYTVNAPGESKLYAEKELRARQQRFLSTWLNSLTFLQLYGTKDGYQADAIFEKADSSLDRWIVSRFHSTIEIVIRSLDILDVVVAARSIETFVDDLSNWWLRRSRDAIKNPKTKKAKSSLLYSLLLELTKLAAPFVPFTAEYVYQELKAFSDDRALAESVHMDRYPMGIKKYINHDLEHKMCMIRMASSVILQKRAVEGIKIRQPLTKVTLKVPQDLNIDVEDQILISDEVNIKSVEIEHNDTGKEDASIEVVNLDTVLTDELINEAADRERIRAVQEKRKNLQLQPSELANLKLEIPKDKKEFQALMSQIKNIGVATCTTASLVPLSELGPDAESIILHSGVQHFVLTKRGIKKLTK